VSKHLDPRVVAAVKGQLNALEPARRMITAREAVAELEPEIRAAMARGYTLEEIAERIQSEIKISPNTLKAYLYSKESRAKSDGATRTARRRS
jgi:DNA-binding NarL/FixJ family response regulator